MIQEVESDLLISKIETEYNCIINPYVGCIF